MADEPDSLVVGVDYGTLSGRAVVVRVRDGAELGTGVHAYRHGVIDRALPATGLGPPAGLGAARFPTASLDVLIGDDSIGRGIVDTLRDSRSPAVLMRSHGPFTVGRDARAAVKAAVMVEDVARTVHYAHQLGTPDAIDAAAVDRLYERYQNVYGQ
ncbi:Ribulokinase [Streptomyces badius]